jgi:hypothetical protein
MHRNSSSLEDMIIDSHSEAVMKESTPVCLHTQNFQVCSQELRRSFVTT